VRTDSNGMTRSKQRRNGSHGAGAQRCRRIQSCCDAVVHIVVIEIVRVYTRSRRPKNTLHWL
jgi:hypothetical protein